MREAGARVERRAPDGLGVSCCPLPPSHIDDLYYCFGDVVARGEGYPHLPPLTRAVFEETWIRAVSAVIGASVEGRFAGAYYLKPNQPGRGAHVANVGYVVDRSFRGRGIGRLLVEDSIERAPRAGFDALQANLVFASNPAGALYERMGWQVVGTVPDAVARDDGSREAAIIYWRPVGDGPRRPG